MGEEIQLFQSSDDLVITSNTFGLLRRVLIEHLGLQKAKRFLLRFGRDLGVEKSKEVMKVNIYNVQEAAVFANKIHTSLGHVSKVTAEGSVTVKEGKHSFENTGGVWFDSFEANLHLEHFKKASECSCYILSGFASGYLTTIYDEDIYVKETSCKSMGAENCTFEVNTKEQWEKLGEKLEIYDTQTIEDELEITYDKLIENQTLLKKVTDFHSKITENIAQQNDIQKLLETASSLVNLPVYITDLEGQVMYKEGVEESGFILKRKTIKRIRNMPQTQTIFDNDLKLLITPINLELRPFAYCIFLYDQSKSIDINDHLFLERLAVAASLCFLNEKVSFEATERLKINFLDRLIYRQFKNFSEINLHSNYISPKIKPPYRTLSLKLLFNTNGLILPDLYKLILHMAKSLKQHNLTGFLSQKGDNVILFLYNNENYQEIKKSLLVIFKEIEKSYGSFRIKGGISDSSDNLEDFHKSLSEAEQAMNFPTQDRLVEYTGLGLFGALLENFNSSVLTRIGQSELGTLLEPNEKSSELLYTLYVFLKNNQKLEQTMLDLSLSIGGIRYRISKIEKLLGKNLKDATTAAHLLLMIETLILLKVISFDKSFKQ